MAVSCGGRGGNAGPGSTSEQSALLLKQLYRTMRTMENRVGGGEGVEGIYGSITETGVSKIMNALAEFGGMGASSTLVDVGAGLGRPLLHALCAHGVAGAWGIEVDPVKVQKAEVFMKKTLEVLSATGLAGGTGPAAAALASGESPRLDCSSIEAMDSLSPATHVYSFWEGIPSVAKQALGTLFSQSETCQAIAVVQRALRNRDHVDYFNELGFDDVQVVKDFPVTMSGSGRTFRAYIIRKNGVSGAVGADLDLGSAQPVEGAAEQGKPSSGAEAKRKGGLKSAKLRKKSASVLPFKKIKKYARSKHKVKISSTP